MKRMKGRLLTVLLSLAMVFTMMPLMTGTVHAATQITVDGIKYILNDDNTAAVANKQDTNITGGVTIPSSITADGTSYSVTSIGEYAFSDCSSLNSIDIPSSLTNIGEHAFGYCSNLTSISIPCDFNKALFNYSGLMAGESDDTFSVEGTETTGTFEYIHDYSDPNYEWSEDRSTCRAAGVCSKCRNEVVEDAKVSIQEDEIDNWQGSKKLTYSAEFDDPGFEDQVKIELHCSTVLNREVINCILQVPDSGLPKDLYFKAVSVEPGSDRWKELYRQLDDNRHVENAAFFDTYLLSQEKDYPFPMPLYEKVRMLFQIPSGWDSDDMETVIVSDLLDIYFEEEIVTRGGVDYVAFMTDHLGTFAMYDKLKENEHLLTKTDKVEPTCTKAGTEAYWTCTECGKKFADESATKVIDAPATIPSEGHKWDAGKVTKKATEQAEGVKTYTCTVCKATKTETIPKLKPSAPKVSGTPLAKLTAKSKSITISWNKIQGAAGYDIFFARCNHDNKKIATKSVKTIKGNKTFKWTKSGLKKGTAYKFYVRAYVTKNGKKTYVSKSPIMHAYTGGGNKKYTNAKSVTVKKKKVSLKKGKTYKIKAKVNKVKKNKKLMPKSHAPMLRYMTSNSKIASVNFGGKITAKGKGTCYIYVYAHNGVSKRIKITVK